VVSGQRLYLSDSKYGLIVVSRADGRVLDRFTPAYGATTSPLVKAGRAFLLTNGGHVYSFRLTPPAGS